MGAQRVKKNFNEIESRAQQVDQEREELAKNMAIQEAKSKEEQDKQMYANWIKVLYFIKKIFFKFFILLGDSEISKYEKYKYSTS